MRFPTTSTKGQWRPIVPIRVQAPNGKQLFVDALVDTGCDMTLFTPAAAELLQLDLSQVPETPINSALGTVDTYQAVPLTLEIRRPPDVLRWTAHVGFVKRRLTYCILGTRGFFEFFQLNYDASQRQFELLPNESIPAIGETR